MISNKNVFEFTLDIKRPTRYRRIQLVAGDTLNRFAISVRDDGTAIDLSTGWTVLLVFKRADGRTCYQDSDTGISIDGSTVSIDVYNTSFSEGTNTGELQLYHGNDLITSSPIEFDARRPAMTEDAIESSTEYPALVKLIKLLNDMTANVTTLEAGSNATITLSKSDGAFVLSFGVPRGTDGANGSDGADGADGQEVSLQKTATHIQWKVGDGAWQNLVALSEITPDIVIDLGTDQDNPWSSSPLLNQAIENGKLYSLTDTDGFKVIVLAVGSNYLKAQYAFCGEYNWLYSRFTDDLADNAVLSWGLWTAAEQTSNKVPSISESSTDAQYPSAKCVYDAIANVAPLPCSVALEKIKHPKGSPTAIIRVHLQGISAYTEGDDLKLKLYRKASARGKGGRWGYADRWGYGQIAGTTQTWSSETITHPAVPVWMPNDGYIQEEIPITASDISAGYKDIDLCTYLLPLVKLRYNASTLRLFGCAREKRSHEISWHLFNGNSLIGLPKNTVEVGIAQYQSARYFTVVYDSANPIGTSRISRERLWVRLK